MSRILLCSLLFLVWLSGCAISPFTTNNSATYEDSDSQRNWYPLPGNGEHITVTNSSKGAEESVTVVDAYYAASGRSCSLYSETGAMNPSGLACRDENRWVALPFIVNPDSQPNNG